MKRLWTIIVTTALILSGCAVKKEIESSQAYVITVKNPSIALSDTGFVNKGPHYTSVQIFAAGNVLFHLEMMGEYICLEGKCLDKLAFNRQFFMQEHYAELMQELLNKEPIYHGEKLKKTASGFEQSLKLDSADIFYAVDHDSVLFKDTKNGVLFRLKPLP